MSFRPRMKTLAWAVSIALAQLATSQAMADSAVGIDSVLGNTLNPPGRSNIPKPQAVDTDLIGTVRRSPSGQLYGVPQPEAEQNQSESGWLYNGEVEAGGIGFSGDEKNAFFRTYKDTTHGAILNWFSMDANKPDEARYVQVYGGGVGRKDQFYGVLTGKYNEWKLRAFYNETFHIFTDSWKTPYDGEGTGNLSLAGGLAIPQRIVDGSAHATGDANYIGIATTCSAATPCWSYNGTLYGLGAGATVAAQQTTQLNAIRGIMGTPTANGTMPVTPTPQSGQAGAIAAKLAAMDVKDLSLSRKKAGLRLDNTLSDAWKSYVSYSYEKREGARPFGLVYNNQFSADIAEPIDYDTHEFLTGLSFARDKNQINLRASYSRFQNNIDSLNVEFPILAGVTNSGVLNHTTYALNPDNDAFNVKAEYGRDLDFWKSRFTAALSYGVNRQDAKLLAPITGVMNADYANAGVTTFTGTNPGFAAGTGLVSSWNTTRALSQTTADQEIDNYLGNLALSMKPTDALRVKAGVRYFATDNKGGYMAYNPLTGQFGRGPLDPNSVVNIDAVVGSQQYANGQTITANSGCYVPPGYPAPTVPGCRFANGAAGAITNGNNVPVFGQARSTQQTNYVAGVDYDLTRFQSVNAQYEQELFHRTFRERADTWEDKYKVGYVNRDLWDWGSMRLSYEEDRKRGSEYRYRTFEDLGTGLPGLDVNYIIQQAAAGNPLYNNTTTFAANLFSRYSYYFRKYDQADRDQSILNARFIITPRDDMDVGLTLQAKDVKYPDSYYGMEKDSLNSATIDVNFQPSTDTNLFGFVSHQDSKKSMKMNSGQAVGVVTTWCTAAQVSPDKYWLCSDGNGTATQPGTSGTRPLSSAWSSDTEDNNQVVGLGMSHNFGRFTLGLDYAYSYGQTKITYKYGSTAISSAPALQANGQTLQQNADAVNAAAGYSLDDMTFDQQTLTLNFVMMLTKQLGIRVFDRYEQGKVNDWHYDNVIMNKVTNIENGNLMTDAGPQSYHANEIGVLLNYKF